MDWPTRSLRSRIVWLRLRLRFWWARRGRGAGGSADREPVWWSEFDRAFWSHVRSQGSSDARPQPRPGAHPPHHPKHATS